MTRRGGTFRFGIAAALVAALSCAAPAAYCDAAEPLADPTRPPAVANSATAAAVARPAPRVSAILISANRRVAIVDGRAVQKGDRVGGALIEEILDDGVRYTRDGRSVHIHLPRARHDVRRPLTRRQQ